MHGQQNINISTYSKEQRDQVIRRRGLVTSELRHQTSGQNDNSAKR